MILRVRLFILMMLLISAGIRAEDLYAPGDQPPTTQPGTDPNGSWRQPIQAVLDDTGENLFVLCQRTPMLVRVNLGDRSNKQTLSLPGEPQAMVLLDNRQLVVADGRKDQLLWIDALFQAEAPLRAVRVAGDPRQLLLSRDRRYLWVSCRVGRRVQALDPSTGQLLWERELPFAPHCLAEDPQSDWLVVADAFRGGLATLEAPTGRVVSIHSFPGTNIRGLAFTPDGHEVIFAHQIISEKSMIERESVRWGAFITNNVRRVRRAVLNDPSADVIPTTDLGFVGGFGHGAGDPGKLLYPRSDCVLLCLTGVNEVGIDTGWPLRPDRVRVGRRPIDLVIDPAGKLAYVVNQFDDGISVLDIDRQKVVDSISLGPLPEETSTMRGEILFHDASLSLDDWYSCQSCHTDGETNNSNSDTLSDGGYGSPKNTPSLRGVGQTGPWSWVGRFDSLEDQIASTIEHTMQSNRLSRRQTEDLAAYLRTLEPRSAATRSADSLHARGRIVFEKQGCAECHAGDKFTRPSLEDVGMDDGLAGHRLFNPPSLRSVGQTAPYFHDGRAASLEEVIDRFAHQLQNPLLPEDRSALLRYLQSL